MWRWAMTLGLAGFAAGFVGPLVLDPQSNIAPITGIVFTGPAGLALGALLGAATRWLGLPRRTDTRLLSLSAVTLALLTLYICIPEARKAADLAELDIRACTPAGPLRAETVARLADTEVARAEKRATLWGDRFDKALAQTPGNVVEAQLLRQRAVYRGESSWRRGALQVTAWEDRSAAVRLFWRGPCPAPGRALLAIDGATGVWPPHDLAEMLDLRTAAPPADLADFAQAP